MKHLLAEKPFAEYVPFTNFQKGNASKACLVKGWNSLDLEPGKVRFTVEDCPRDCWIQRRLRVRDQDGNYHYCGLIVVDVDDPQYGEMVMNRIIKEQWHCQARKTNRGYHFIFAFIPDSWMSSVTQDWMLALDLEQPAESTHQRTSFVTDNVVDYKFTEIVRHIVDAKDDYVGRVRTRYDRVVTRELCYDLQYTPEEQLKHNAKLHMPDWFPPYEEMPDWLIPLKSDTDNGKISEKIMFFDEVQQMVGMAETYITDKRVNTAAFLRCLDRVFNYTLVENSSGDRDLYIYHNGRYELIRDDIFIGVVNSILMNQDFGENQVVNNWSATIFDLLRRTTNRAHLCNYKEMDGNQNIVNFQNGILDLTNGKLMSHSPNYLSSIQIPCKWDCSDDTPEPEVFMAYLKRLTDGLPDQEELIHLILQYCGCCIANVPVWKTKGALIFQGKSNAGKSQIFNMMFDLIGPHYSIPTDLQVLTTNQFATSSLYRKRLTGNSDLQHSTTIRSANVFKQLSGGDLIYAEVKYRNTFSFIYEGGMIYCCNESPKFGDADQALYNRLYIIPCNNPIPVQERDPDLLNKFRKEYPQIVKLMLREMLALKKKDWKLYCDGTIAQERHEFDLKSDNVTDFIELGVTTNSRYGYQSIMFWFGAYRQYCKDFGYPYSQILGKQAFIKRFEELTGCERVRQSAKRCLTAYPTSEAVALQQKVI